MAVRRARLWGVLSVGLAGATGCSLLVGTETRTLGVDGGGTDAAGDELVPDAGADTSDDANDAAAPLDAACGAACLSQAQTCGQSCVAVYTTCAANCGNSPPCKTGCATSESACFGNCDSSCTGCMSGAGCANQASCADASHP